MINYEKVLKEFKKYVEQFDFKNEKVAMKISHSYHVADLMYKLAKRLELKEEEIILAKTIGLLHDIGRFVQFEKTGVYDDTKSKIDHATLADDYLFGENHIEDFEIPEKYYKVIRVSLLNHNKLEIEPNLSEEELFYAKLIRDADKIDIFRQEATRDGWVFNAKIMEEVKNNFYAHQLVDIKNNKTESDNAVSELAYIFDINFKESYKLLEETDNLELFLSVVEIGIGFEEEFDSIKKEIRTYLEERIKG